MPDTTDTLTRFRVSLRTAVAPGLTFYRGHVDVYAEDAEQAVDRAIDQLRRTSFPDRDRSCWSVVSVVPK